MIDFKKFIQFCDYDVAAKVKQQIEAVEKISEKDIPILRSEFGAVEFVKLIDWLEKVMPRGPLLTIAIAGIESYACVCHFANGEGRANPYGSMRINMDDFGTEPTTRIKPVRIETCGGDFDAIVNKQNKTSDQFILFGLTMRTANEPILIPLAVAVNLKKITL